MNRTWKVSKYLLSEFIKPLVIYYVIIFGLAVLAVVTTLPMLSHAYGKLTVSGLSAATFIFLFIAGLNCFKANFKFMQANNISRKRFYLANIITLIIVSAFMAVVDVLITALLAQIIPYVDGFQQIYEGYSLLTDIIWSFAFYVFLANAGWFITMLYYRCNKLMKIVVSFSPLILFIVAGYINNLTKGASTVNFDRLFTVVFSLDKLNPYIATTNVLIGTVGVMALCYLLIYRAPVKE